MPRFFWSYTFLILRGESGSFLSIPLYFGISLQHALSSHLQIHIFSYLSLTFNHHSQHLSFPTLLLILSIPMRGKGCSILLDFLFFFLFLVLWRSSSPSVHRGSYVTVFLFFITCRGSLQLPNWMVSSISYSVVSNLISLTPPHLFSLFRTGWSKCFFQIAVSSVRQFWSLPCRICVFHFFSPWFFLV